jgi:hypothetical protein
VVVKSHGVEEEVEFVEINYVWLLWFVARSTGYHGILRGKKPPESLPPEMNRS